MIYKLFAYSIVWPLQALTPLCFAVFPACALDWKYSLTSSSGSWKEILLLCYSGTEVLFYFWFKRTLRSVQVRQPPPITTRERRLEIWHSIKDSAIDGENPYSFLRSWFSVSSLSQVSRTDLKMWLAWAVFDRQLEEVVSYSTNAELEEMIADGEKEFNVTVPHHSASEKALTAMRLNVDPVEAYHRPFIYYAVTELMGVGADVILRWWGFRRERIGAVYFWLRHADDSREFDETPLVFVHGVGIGLAAYLPLLRALSRPSAVNRTIILIELPHVSMKLNVDVVPRMDVIAECSAIMLKRYNLPPALWMAHSLGTFVFAAVQRLQPHLVAGVVLVDPVCFMLWEPDLLKNFCYLNPETPMQIVQQYHISRELSISYYFHRHFWWHECVQFAKDMPERSLVIISELDGIYNTKRVIRYLESNLIPLHVIPGMQHGGWIMDGTATDKIANSAVLSEVPLVGSSSYKK